MIKYNENTLEKLNNLGIDNIYIITDFDRTMTTSDSLTSWSCISKSPLAPRGYAEKRDELYKKYRPIEIDNNISEVEKNTLMKKWWQEHINLFIEYKISEDIIKDAYRFKASKLRMGTKELLQKCYKFNVPVIIISAGIGNFIENILKQNNCYYDNIYILSNFIEFKDGIAIGIKSDNLIHSNNKNETSIPKEVLDKIKDRHNPILMGDAISDLKMTSNKNVYKMGFLNDENLKDEDLYLQNFDMVCYDNTSFTSILDIIKIFGED